jgi:PAS domain S-box-containing protein
MSLSENSGSANPSGAPLRAIIDLIPILAWTALPDGSVEFVNRRWLDYTGLPESEALDWAWTAAIHPDDLGMLLGRWKAHLASGEAGEFEARMRRFDGEYRWFLIRANSQRDALGEILKWYGTNTEIEDRRRAEQALLSSEQGFRLMIDSVPGLVSITTPAGEVEFVNRRLLEYFGRTLEELQGWKSTDAVHPDDIDAVVDMATRGFASEQPHDFEHRLRRADGVYRWFHYRNVPLRDEEGRLLRWYGLLNDIDDLKNAEVESRSNERSLRLLVESIPGLVFTTTATGEVEFVNRTLLDYFGKSLPELQAWQMSDAVHPDDLPNTIEEWKLGVALGKPYEFEQRLRRGDGVYRWFHFRAVPMRDEAGRITRWYGLLADIEDLKRTEEALRSAQGGLARATNLAAMSELSASIAHEIKQPLSAMLTHGHACQRWLTADPPNIARARLSAERIIRDGQSAGEVIERIRSLFRHAPPAKSLLDLNEVIEEVCSLLSEQIRARNVVLDIDLRPDLPQVPADRIQIQQVLANLAHNGIDAMDDIEGRPKCMRIHSCALDGEIVVEISDHGIGLKDPATVFEPFYTTKESGMGMGLAICRSIIEAHDGRLWARSNASYGATFGFALRIENGQAR